MSRDLYLVPRSEVIRVAKLLRNVTGRAVHFERAQDAISRAIGFEHWSHFKRVCKAREADETFQPLFNAEPEDVEYDEAAERLSAYLQERVDAQSYGIDWALGFLRKAWPRSEPNETLVAMPHGPLDKKPAGPEVTSTKESELVPEQAVEPLVVRDATDGLGQMELPIADLTPDAIPVAAHDSEAGGGRGSVDTQARRLDFWSTSRDSGTTATVSYRRRRPYAAPDASTEDAAPEEPIETAAVQALTESEGSEAPIDAMPSETTAEVVAPEVPVEAVAEEKSMDASTLDEPTEAADPITPLVARSPDAATEETRAPKRGRKPKALAVAAAPEITTEEAPAPKRGRKPKALVEAAAPELTAEEQKIQKRGRKPKALAETAAPEVSAKETRPRKRGPKPRALTEAGAQEGTTQEAQIPKRGPKQQTLPGMDAPEAPTRKTQSRKPRQERSAPTATQSPSGSSTYVDLLAQLASIDAQLAQLRAAEVPKVVAEIQHLMDQYDLSIDDIAGERGPGRTSRAAPTQTKVAPPPKYRNPKTGQTWSGRGRTPAWIGKRPERFLVS